MGITSVSRPSFAASRSTFLSRRSSFLPSAASLAWRGNWGSNTLAWIEQGGSMRNKFDRGCRHRNLASRMRKRESERERERERWRESEREGWIEPEKERTNERASK
jgi:hypothetical protein